MNLLPVQSVSGDLVKVARTDPRHLDMKGNMGPESVPGQTSFGNAMLKAMEGVNASQLSATELSQRMLTDPDSVDAHDITIAQAEASLSLNIARSVLDRVVRGWKEIINAR